MEDETINFDSPEMTNPGEDMTTLFDDNSEELSSVETGESTDSPDSPETGYYQNIPEFETPASPTVEDILPDEPCCSEEPSEPSIISGLANDIPEDDLNDVISNSPSEDHFNPTFKGFDCTAGCAGNCAGKCDGCCHNSCYNSCKSTYSK